MIAFKAAAISANFARFLTIGISFALVLLAGCSTTASASPTRPPTGVTMVDVEGYKADIQELADRIKANHPRPFRFISESEFDQLVSARMAEMTPQTTRRDFLWAFSEVLSSIRCGHSRLPYFNQENALIADEERLPLDVRFLGDRLFVLDPLTNADTIAKGDEIASINGRDVKDLQAEIFRHIQAEGVAPQSKVHAFNDYANSYMTYALGFPETYAVTLVGQGAPSQLHPISDFSFKPLIHPNDPCQDRLCYRVDAARNVGIMTIHTFAYYGDRGQIFADYVDQSLEDIVDNRRSALIIDIRSHDGGSGSAGAYILRRLANAPFTYFGHPTDNRAPPEMFEQQRPVDVGLNVPVFLIVDGDTVSAAPHFAALFKEHNMGTIIGERMGGNKSTNDGKQTFRSTVHDVEYNLARMRFDVDAPSQPIEDPVQPDIVLSYTLDDVIEGHDSIMDYTLNLVANRN